MELMRHVTVGQFVPGDSLVHRLDPRIKLFLVGLAMGIAFTVVGAASLATLGALCLLGASLARLPVTYFLGGLRTIALLLVVTLFFNLFFVRGGPLLVALGPLSVTRAGAGAAGLMGARLVLLMLMTSLFTLTTSPIRMTDALERILAPLRRVGLPSAEIAMMMSIALRFIPTLIETAERIMKAQMARGARFSEGSAVSRARALLPVLVPLFVHAFGAAEELAVAMEARCYRGGSHRTRMVSLTLRPLDFWVLLIAGGTLCAVLWADQVGLGRWR